jgi:hypothetical protein
VRGLPDPAASRAVLIGVSRYDRMALDRQLPSVERGLTEFAEMLRAERVWGLPRENCTVLHQPADADTVIRALRTAVEEARDTLLLYYAGHGLIDPALPGNELHLALPGTPEPGGTHLALSFSHIRREFRANSRGTRRQVVILDCCWSGLAVGGEGADPGGGNLLGAAAIEGTAVLTATAATKKALAPPGEDYPAFTGALIDVLARGIPGGPRFLDMATLYEHLADRLGVRGRPRPEFANRRSGAQITLARNVAFQAPADSRPANLGSAEQVVALRRAGLYREADDLQRQDAEIGNAKAMRERVSELRRMGQYTDAAEMEPGYQPPEDRLGVTQER